MELINRTPLQAFAFRQFDRNGKLDCVVAVRGTFLHRQGEVVALSAEQEGFQWTDAYVGDPHEGIMLRQTDLTPEKPGTDITFLGNTYPPNGQASKSWTCSLRVGAKEKSLRVYGERHWRPILKDVRAGFSNGHPEGILQDWSLDGPLPAARVPLDWHHAYGGTVPGTGDIEREIRPDVETANPLGCGIVNSHFEADIAGIRAPSIMAVDETNLDWRTRYRPEGFGPISPWWRPRQQYAGTYDDAWLAHRHPLLPLDFDPHFWQCAHPDLIAEPWLKGDEDYALSNLHPDLPLAHGRLPGVTLGVRCEQEGSDKWFLSSLDGVQFDWREGETVLLTWRARFPLPEADDVRLTLNRVVFSQEERRQVEAQEA
ncbi:DUF2169 family type VI secretion system accessory protein [Labrys sp. (in: a-proteobacteria)]|uniref:DUF2169 family type VI secretion system accessory protein n=1 Tax=Labrys sp. (in: a-proteobacteria) TaxID=1917972 RepID=UPI0039E63ABF